MPNDRHFEQARNFVAWLRQIAINHYRNDVRKAASMRSATLDEAGLEEVVERQHRARLESEQAQNKWAQLSECLHLLPEHQQDVVQRFLFPGTFASTIVRVIGPDT